MENRRANFAAQVAAQETRMGTCDVTAGILTQIFNNRDITRGMCTANNIIGSIVGTVVDSFKCQLECSVISSDPYCVKRCESRIRGEQQRCERLAQSACVRAVALRVKDEVTVKQLASPLFNPDCEDTTPAACPNGQLRSILANVKKARVALGVAEMKANQASEALAACLGGQ
jgi:hypothetical protein